MNNEQILEEIKKLKDLISVHTHDGLSSAILSSILKLISELRTDFNSGDYFKYILASDNLKISADTEKTFTNSTYALKKEVRVNSGGTIRTYFEITSESAVYTVLGRVYINGVGVGVERTGNATWATYTEDFIVKAGDLVQLYCLSSSSVPVKCRNFRLSYDVYNDKAGVIITN